MTIAWCIKDTDNYKYSYLDVHVHICNGNITRIHYTKPHMTELTLIKNRKFKLGNNKAIVFKQQNYAEILIKKQAITIWGTYGFLLGIK